MPRYIAFLKNTDIKPSQASDTLMKARKLVRGISIIIGDCRVSSSRIELDIRAPHDKMEELMKKLASIAEPLEFKEVSESLEEKYAAIEKGKRLFDEERFWEAHEALEHPWKQSEGMEKEILQGIILLCASMVHFQKGQEKEGFSILSRATEKLEGKGFYHGVDAEKLRKDMLKLIKSRKFAPLKLEVY